MTDDTHSGSITRRPGGKTYRGFAKLVLSAGIGVALGALVALPLTVSAQTAPNPSAACLSQQDYGFTTHGACVAFLASGNQGAAFIEDQCHDPSFVTNLERITGLANLNEGQCVQVALTFFGH